MVEGVFARAFRSGLRPVELGRRLVRVMDTQRSVGVSGRPVVPNAFTVTLSPDDHEQFADIADTLVRELCDAAREHARDEGYTFMGPVTVELVVDESSARAASRSRAGSARARAAAGPGSLLLPTGERVTLGEFIVTVGRMPESTSCSPTPTSAATTPRSAPRATAMWWSTSGPPTAPGSTACAISEHSRCATATRSCSATPG
jgi:hypothetical protein